MPEQTGPQHGGDLGRGPQSASTFYKNDVIVTLLYDGLTQAERSLAANDQEDAVTHMRHLLQQTVEANFVQAVERLTGRPRHRVHQRQQHHPRHRRRALHPRHTAHPHAITLSHPQPALATVPRQPLRVRDSYGARMRAVRWRAPHQRWVA